MVIIIVVIIFIFDSIARFPRHFVLLLEPSSGVREPRRHLRQCHLCDNCEHDLLAFGGVRVLFVLVQPGLQGTGRFAGGVFPTRPIQIHTVSATKQLLFSIFLFIKRRLAVAKGAEKRIRLFRSERGIQETARDMVLNSAGEREILL